VWTQCTQNPKSTCHESVAAGKGGATNKGGGTQVEINNVDHAHATTFDVISFEESRAHAREQNNR